MENKKFLDDIKKKLIEWDVLMDFSPEKQVHTLGNGQGLACSGFFSELPRPKLAVAMGKPENEWTVILAHEFSHANQWKEQADVWTNLFHDWSRGREEASDALDRWLEGEDWSESQIQDVVGRIRDVERDCEERTVKLLTTYGLLDDPTEYIQKSNAYVYFYNHVAKTRKWYEAGKAPYEIPEIWTRAPKEFIKTESTPPELEQAFWDVFGGRQDKKSLKFK